MTLCKQSLLDMKWNTVRTIVITFNDEVFGIHVHDILLVLRDSCSHGAGGFVGPPVFDVFSAGTVRVSALVCEVSGMY